MSGAQNGVEGSNNSSLPQHIAVVMDGNGRWANKRHLPRVAGHKSGVKATQKIVESCAKKNIKALTIFAFSSENWNRPKSEVSSILSLFVTTLNAEVKRLHKKGVRVKFIGDRSRFSEKLQKSIAQSEELTSANTGLQLNIAANYGGRWDIVNACKSLISEVHNNKISVEQVDENLLNSYIALGDIPEPDLFIRTGGEQRISNFLIWQLAYTELYFVDTLWPDFSEEELDAALSWYEGRQRRFGKTGQQVAKESTLSA